MSQMKPDTPFPNTALLSWEGFLLEPKVPGGKKTFLWWMGLLQRGCVLLLCWLGCLNEQLLWEQGLPDWRAAGQFRSCFGTS